MKFAPADVVIHPPSIGDHIVNGGHGNNPHNGNALGIKGQASTFGYSPGPNQSPNVGSMSSTPALTPDAESRSPSIDHASPPPNHHDAVIQDQPMMDCDTPDNNKALAIILALQGHNSVPSVSGTQDAPPHLHSGMSHGPYRDPQAVATGAVLSGNNITSTDAALAGGVQSDGVGGIISSRNRAAQIVTAPSIVPSHGYDVEGASTTQQQSEVRTGNWSNPAVEKDMLPPTLATLNQMAFGRVSNLQCTFISPVRDAAGNLIPDAAGHAIFHPCGKSFPDKTRRDRHAQSVHLETLHEFCEFCNKEYSRRDSLLRHIQEIKCKELKERKVSKDWVAERMEAIKARLDLKQEQEQASA
ncbi:hypothetical protein PENSPDRAFT_159552 [Peniophora sp. CONT]|nr:hypothetical protein PENSPDRAFT_159552 [Peniophora sp. CONT]